MTVFQATILKFVIYLGVGRLKQMQNLSTVSPKLPQLGQETLETGWEYHHSYDGSSERIFDSCLEAKI